MPGLASAAGLVGFLAEPDTELQVFALQAANEEIGLLWTEFAGAIGQIEALYEDKSFPERELAALVAAKIFYHLQAYDESMAFALGAGKLFDVEREGEFEDTIIAKCIDTYISLSAHESTTSSRDAGDQDPDELKSAFTAAGHGSANTAASLTSPITPFSQSTLPSKSLLSREDDSVVPIVAAGVGGPHPSAIALPRDTQKALQGVIRRIFERCFEAGAYRQVVGIAVEARNLDILRETIARASEGDKAGKAKAKDKFGRREELMDYLLDICMNVIQERGLRNQILQLILDLLLSHEIASPDYFSIAKCLVYLGQPSMASNMLRQLIEQNNPKSVAVAYQISFDLYDNGTQEFLTRVIDGLPASEEHSSEFGGANGHAVRPSSSSAQPNQESQPLLSDIEGQAVQTSTVVSRLKDHELIEEHRIAYNLIRDILHGSKSMELELEFLFRANKSDRAILTKMKTWLEARHSIFHSAVTFANACMNCGTTSDWFIRENLEWLGRAVNWSKFSVTASLGVIHRGNMGQGHKLLEPYLKDASQGGATSAYAKGGALFALGFIYTNHGQHILDYLHNQLKNSTGEDVVQHGAALGLGVAGMATENEDIADELKLALFGNSAISGQATGLAIGLVMLGSGNVKLLEELVAHSHETEHDKTIRGMALGMALIMYARQEAADEMINGLLDDPDPTIRYGGIMTIALAYCGTSSNKAVRRLLHVAVSDVNDDVRRTAVMSLGFVLFRKPSSVPRMVELLAESYNPHVRYGATMALGIACAGTGLEEAVDLLEPMMKDSTDFVRQGAFIALAMIMIQQSEAMSSKVVTIRKHLQKVVGDRHEDAMAKFGAALALGIIDAGGRNCTIGLQTQTGNLNMAAIVGMAVFTQYWYWFPLTHFISLSFVPTTVIAVDQDLEVPKFALHCAARPSYFAYPPTMEVKTEEAPEKVKTAVLSTTALAQRRKQAKERQQRRDSMDVDQAPATPKPSASGEGSEKMDVDEDAVRDDKAGDDKAASGEAKTGKDDDSTAAGAKSLKSRVEKEKIGFELENVSRVLPEQLKYISFTEGRYVPVKKPTGGVVLVMDTQPSEPKILIERQVKKAAPKPAPDSANAQNHEQGPSTPAGHGHRSASERTSADAASVLTAVDEDEDPMEEAQVPGEFDYYTDDEDGDKEEEL